MSGKSAALFDHSKIPHAPVIPHQRARLSWFAAGPSPGIEPRRQANARGFA